MADEAAGYGEKACIHRLQCRDCLETNHESSDLECSDQDICIECKVESGKSTSDLFSGYQGPSTKVQAIIEAITHEFTAETATPIQQYVIPSGCGGFLELIIHFQCHIFQLDSYVGLDQARPRSK